MRKLTNFARIGLCALALGLGALSMVLVTYVQLPSVDMLADVQLQVPLKIYTRDGFLLAEYGDKRRIPLAIEDIPKPLVYALIATEDRRFYEHKGVDLRGLLRAAMVLVARGSKEQGGSTITMQVARNFFLTRHKTFTRKLNEILLALKIEQELPKEKILELYLNKVYFGKRAYGVAAAAEVYYGKTVHELTLAEMAMIAGLPQAPSVINPINNPKAAEKRRAHVLSRMLLDGFINEAQCALANQEDIQASYHDRAIDVPAPFVAEMVRLELVDRFGDEAYTSGFEVYTTVDARLQKYAQSSVQTALLDYDARHGYRGPIRTLELHEDIHTALKNIPRFQTLQPVVITNVRETSADAKTVRDESITLPWEGIRWAQRNLERASAVLTVGDIVYVRKIAGQYQLAEIPEVSGALVALSPDNGDILAIVGGFDFQLSKFNRATQAARQPGSNFKPFIYLAAFEQGYTPASLMNDAPMVFQDTSPDEAWRPQNDNHEFYGPTRLRLGLTLSRNLVSIRLLQAIGVNHAIPVLERFGFSADRLPKDLSLSLGTLTTSPLEMATAYASFANGGYRVYPRLIHHIEDHQGHIVYENKTATVCPTCDTPNAPSFAQIPPAERIISAEDAYIMTHILQDAIQSGTGKLARRLGRSDLAGKTGTTNQYKDAWYSGYNRDLVVTTWVGYDDPRSLHEYAAYSALPMWVEFMEKALRDKPEHTLAQPAGITTVRIDPTTGLLARPNQPNAVFEVFKTGEAPTRMAPQPVSRTTQKPKKGEDIAPVRAEEVF